MTHLRRIASINHRQFFPVEQTLIFKHLYKAVETPIIIHRAIADTPLLASFKSRPHFPRIPRLIMGHLTLPHRIEMDISLERKHLGRMHKVLRHVIMHLQTRCDGMRSTTVRGFFE